MSFNPIPIIESLICDEESIKALHFDIVWKGKHSPKLRAIAKERGDSPKYCCPEQLDNSGAIRDYEAIFLYKIVKYFNAKKILEIGTWFGTSASVMAEYADAVYTCDKHDVYVADNPKVKYSNEYSTSFIKRLKHDGQKFDLVFADGKVDMEDAKRIVSMMNKFVFVTHDYAKGQKGYKAVKVFQKLLGEDKLDLLVNGIIAILRKKV